VSTPVLVCKNLQWLYLHKVRCALFVGWTWACSTAGWWWVWPVQVDNRDFGLRRRLGGFAIHTLVLWWQDEWNQGTGVGRARGSLERGVELAVSLKALEMKGRTRMPWRGSGMALEALRVEWGQVGLGACERNRRGWLRGT